MYTSKLSEATVVPMFMNSKLNAWAENMSKKFCKKTYVTCLPLKGSVYIL
jgi:hypothetical protein